MIRACSAESFGESLPLVGGNSVEGVVSCRDARDAIVYSSGEKVVLIGLDDVVVVSGPGGVLVARRGRSAEVTDLVPS